MYVLNYVNLPAKSPNFGPKWQFFIIKVGIFRLRPIERYIYNFVYFIFNSHVLHKHKTEIIKMKRNIGALQFYKKLKNKRRSLLLFRMETAAYKMHAFMRRSYFLYFFSFLFCVVRTKKNDLNNAFACHSLGLTPRK